MTDLVGGERVRKDSPRITAYGTVDELNAAVGVARAVNQAETGPEGAGAAARRELDDILRRLQNQLFDLGGELATPPAAAAPGAFRMSGAEVKGLEATIDRCLQDLAPLKSFILPGGGRVSSFLHVARTVCRRAAGEVSRLMREAAAGARPLAYLTRLPALRLVRWRRTGRRRGE